MTDSRVAQDPNRLPWLAEERQSRPRGQWTLLLLGALLTALIVAGVAFWLGAKNATEADERARPVPTVSAPLPAPMPQPIVSRPRRGLSVALPCDVPNPTVVFCTPRPCAKLLRPPRPSQGRRRDDRPAVDKLANTPAVAKPATTKPVVAKPVVARSGPLRVWPATVSEGANGRVVRIGAFGSRANAKKGWWQITRRYPGMRRLKAVGARVPDPPGKIFTGCTMARPAAHSEVLGHACARSARPGSWWVEPRPAPRRQSARIAPAARL